MKERELFALSQTTSCAQVRKETQTTSVHRASRAHGVFTASPGATHTNLASLQTCLVPPFILNCKTSHVRRLLPNLVGCRCVRARSCFTVFAYPFFETARSPQVHPQRSGLRGERWSTLPPIPPTYLFHATRPQQPGTPQHPTLRRTPAHS